jgi:hypothetical protein
MNLGGKAKSGSLLSSGKGLLKKLVYDEVPDAQIHRREPRQPVAGEVIVVELDAQGKRVASHRVFIRDLSKSGCGLWSRARIAGDTTIAVLFQDAAGQAVQRIGTVCHCRGQENTGFAVGVRFTTGQQPAMYAA